MSNATYDAIDSLMGEPVERLVITCPYPHCEVAVKLKITGHTPLGFSSGAKKVETELLQEAHALGKHRKFVRDRRGRFIKATQEAGQDNG